MSQQYGRVVNLITSKGGKGIDLSQMHIQFHVFAPDSDSPPTAIIRVWNLSSDTANQIQKEFDHVSLQAGYVDPGPGVIFDGTIVQTKRGAENAIDSYIDIFASDLDELYNFTLVNKTLAAGSTPKDRVGAVIESAQASGAKQGSIPDNLGTGGTLPRGKVMFGMAREQMNDIAKSTNTSWFVENGKVNMIKDDGYLPGDVVVINSETGMLGVPENTNDGIEVRCLLNPGIKVGTRIKLNNADIATTKINQQGAFPTYGNINLVASKSSDGVYRVLVREHEGDNRGNTFETRLTCLSVDSSSGGGKVAVAG
jgi:hypothetical protein